MYHWILNWDREGDAPHTQVGKLTVIATRNLQGLPPHFFSEFT